MSIVLILALTSKNAKFKVQTIEKQHTIVDTTMILKSFPGKGQISIAPNFNPPYSGTKSLRFDGISAITRKNCDRTWIVFIPTSHYEKEIK